MSPRRIDLATAALSGLLLGACGESPRAAGPPTDAGDGSEAAVVQEPAEAVQEPAEDSVLFVPEGEEVTELVRENLDRKDSAKDGWRTEELHELAKPQLQAFVHVLAGEHSSREAHHFLDTGFEGLTALRPVELETVFDDGASSVRRPTALDPTRHGEERLEELMDELASALAPEDRHTKVKIFHTDLDPGADDRFTISALVRLSGHRPEGGAIQINSEWRVGYAVGLRDMLRIRWIELAAYEEVWTPDSVFAELTAHAFGELPRFTPELLVGAGEYHFRADRMNGNVYSGHFGLAVGDVNGDGRDDVYVAQHGGLPNLLLLARADGTFEDASRRSGIDLLEKTQSALLLDLDDDGDQDAAIACHNTIFVAYNDGTARFELARQPLVTGSDSITTLSAADYDLDGDLDLYACMYDKAGPLSTTPVPYHDAVNGPPNQLWRNEGDRRWTNATAEVGLDDNNRKYSYGALWDDFDADGDPDLYVANDFGRNHLYRNDSGRFTDVATEVGADDMAAGMGVTAADFDLDGDVDLYVTNMFSSAGLRIATQTDRFMEGRNADVHEHFVRHARGNTLLANAGDGTFTDETVGSGAVIGGWAWGAKALDFNNDGLPDLYSPNGFLTNEKPDDL